MNITDNTLIQFKTEFPEWFYEFKDKVNDFNTVPQEVANFIYFFKCNENGSITSKNIKATKKEITIDKIAKKLNEDSHYKNLTYTVSSLLKSDARIYSASYGIGVDAFMMSHENILKWTSDIRNVLDSLGVKYRNEYSDYGYVYRFVISKSEANLSKF